MGSRVLWAIVGGFLAGVFLASFIPLTPAHALFVIGLGILIGIVGRIDISIQKKYLVVAVALVACGLGMLRMEMAARVGDPGLSARIGQSVVLNGIVTEEPDARETSVRLTVDVSGLASSTVPVRARVLVVAPAHNDVRYGDSVEVRGTLGLPEAFDTTLGRQFDYPKYLAKDGILYTLSFAQVRCVRCQDVILTKGSYLKAAALGVKHFFLDGLRKALPEPEAGLAGGITVGDKRSIGKELSEDFQKVSLIHMLVLSGYNITIVINAAMAVLGTLSQTVRFGVAGVIVVFFALMTGGAASAVRAGAMALIAIFARVTHRVFLAGRILGVVCFAMVAWNPWTLRFDPGFQLSALATLGLILFTPVFSGWFVRIPKKYGLREIVASTCGTQLMVLPLLLYQNGIFSIVALPANLFALITVPAAMSLSFFAAIAGLVSGPFAPLFGAPAYVVLWYEIFVARFFASLPFAAVSIPAFSAWWMLAAYAVLFAGYLYIKKMNGRGQGPAVR